MLREITRTDTNDMASMKGRCFDFEKILPLSLIRTHTKTEDVITVTDEQLSLYRAAAIQAAEKYTGLFFGGQRVLVEPVKQPFSFWEMPGRYFTHKTRFPFAEPFAYLFGDPSRAIERLPVVVGTNEARIAYHPGDMGIGCCNPCRDKAQLQIQYVAGYSTESDLPAGLAIGALKYIAHLIENPGDAIRRSNSTQALALNLDANNPALASGAIDIWRTLKDNAV
jgi:hypothetical protein